jgi:hypothetical protein
MLRHIHCVCCLLCTVPVCRLTNTQFSLEELTAICQEAEAAGTYVAAHAYTPPAIKRALSAGVRSIEHGNWYAARRFTTCCSDSNSTATLRLEEGVSCMLRTCLHDEVVWMSAAACSAWLKDGDILANLGSTSALQACSAVREPNGQDVRACGYSICQVSTHCFHAPCHHGRVVVLQVGRGDC